MKQEFCISCCYWKINRCWLGRNIIKISLKIIQHTINRNIYVFRVNSSKRIYLTAWQRNLEARVNARGVFDLSQILTIKVVLSVLSIYGLFWAQWYSLLMTYAWKLCFITRFLATFFQKQYTTTFSLRLI